MRPSFFAVLFGSALATLASGAQAETYFSASAFDFVALGDMPYHGYGVTDDIYERLIADVNALGTDFVIHVGDTKGGGEDCGDDRQKIEFDNMMKFDRAVFYTPGDNEWTDCHRKAAGGYAPLERLLVVRKLFFAKAESLGRHPMKLVRQADWGTYPEMVENALWHHKGVTFATVHVVGSNNNFETRELSAVEEYFRRDAANVAWIATAFTEAAANGSAAVVLAMQADMFGGKPSRHDGFANTIAASSKGAESFGKPVLVVYGDTHRFVVNQPLTTRDRKVMDNVTFLQVFGAADVHAVRVVVDAEMPGMFAFIPLYVPENMRVTAK